MDYLISNATEIMQLCLGFGFLVVAVLGARCLWQISRLLSQLDQTVRAVDQLIITPARKIHAIYRRFQKIHRWFDL